MRRTTTIVLFAALLAFGGAACSKKSEDASSDTSSTTAAASSSTTSGSGSSSDSSASTTTTKASGSNGSGGSCPTQAEVDAVNNQMDSIGTSESLDVDAMRAAFNASMDAMEQYLPEDLHDDLETVKDAMDKYLSTLGSMDLSSPANLTPEQMQKFQQASAELEKPEIQQAQQNLEDYFKTNCPGINFGGDNTSTTTG